MTLANFKIQNKNIILKCQNILFENYQNELFWPFLFFFFLFCETILEQEAIPTNILISWKLFFINLVFSNETSLFCESKDSFLPIELFFLSNKLLILELFSPKKCSAVLPSLILALKTF